MDGTYEVNTINTQLWPGFLTLFGLWLFTHRHFGVEESGPGR